MQADPFNPPWVSFQEAYPRGFTGRRHYRLVALWLELEAEYRRQVMTKLFSLPLWPGPGPILFRLDMN